ncbi:CACNA1G [Mytilus coruscus]|uniref:Voltage-dependent T-type calcium channel subunit alpha n=1 Tax=Mytilus coruscus TaxID=42192 RepID=A0A6J8EXX7_MYTCO|nr:CACNA1G [Mytilus coruscus]
MIGMGIYGKTTYLDDSWNKLDCFIVIAGVADYIINNAVEYGVDSENLSLSAIRTIRVLRPLRAINRIPSMRILVMLLLDTLPMLGNVLLLCFFVFFIFGIIGVQLWAGVLRNRCFLNVSENISYAQANLSPYYIPKKLLNVHYDYICSKPGESGMRTCDNFPLYQYEGIGCNGTAKMYSNNTPTNNSCVNWNQYYTYCTAGDKNPFQGAISFDNIGLAWVAIFQVISLESWVNIMYYVQDAHSFWDWSYFVALIVIGSFFMINLCLVVIATQFSETKKRETERMMQERKRFQSSSTLASNSEPGGCYAEILKYVAHLGRRAKRKIFKMYYDARGKTHPRHKIKPQLALGKRKQSKGSDTAQSHACNSCSHRFNYFYQFVNNQTDPHISRRNSSPIAPRASPEMSDLDSISSPRCTNFLTVPGFNSMNPSSESINTLAFTATDTLSPPLLKPRISSPNHLAPPHGSISRTPSLNSECSKKLPCVPELLVIRTPRSTPMHQSHSPSNTKNHNNHAYKGIPEDLLDVIGDKQICYLVNDYDKQCNHTCNHVSHDVSDNENHKEKDSEIESKDKKGKHHKNCVSDKIEKFVEHKLFRWGILGAIVINTASMGIEHHHQPIELTEALEYSNIVFCTLFAFEMVLKLIAYGPFGYIKNGFNVFDGFIVILSMVELLQQDGDSGLSVLRTFRLLRILKLVRFLPALRRQLVVMLRTMDNVATFFALLLLFMFIFSILGMNLFGCKFCKPRKDGSIYCNRKNFDSLLWAIITVFQIFVLKMHSVLGMNLFGGKFCWRDDGSPCFCADIDDYNSTNSCICDRANFNSLLWSLVTVFQVLTQEDWNTVLYNGMETTSAWASLYFIALMTFGNYVLFNLLVAILVEGFSHEEEEKKKMKEQRQKEIEAFLAETNNNEEKNQTIKIKAVDIAQIKINNKEKEKMLALCPVTVIKEDNANRTGQAPDIAPPIITHTAATPMPTPQGSPNENPNKDYNKVTLCVHPQVQMDTLSVHSSSTSNASLRSSPRLSPRASPRPSPRPSPRGSPRPMLRSPGLCRSYSYGSRNSWRGRRSRDGERTCLVQECGKSQSVDYYDDDVFTPCTPIPNSRLDCNGHLPLNNQRTLSPQNSIKRQPFPSPRNSLKIRNNSVSSTHSACNSIYLSRQNSFTSRRTMNSLSSMTGVKEDYKQNNLSESPTGEANTQHISDVEDEEDPDAMDETNCSFSWCPEPRGCFKTRQEYALYVLSPTNCFRKLLHHWMAQKWFDNSVLFFIALNCITLAMERPDIPPNSDERQFLNYSNYGFTFIFALEMTIKVSAKGLLIGKHAYLKSGWNVMDGFLVLISLTDIFISLSASSSPRIFGILRVFRLLRTLRPLRVISRAPGLKLVVQTLLSSLRPIGNIVLICCTFFIIFGILGVQLFKGSFYYCKGLNVRHVVNKTECLSDPHNKWVNQKYNFDDLGQALMALFVLASKDGWVSIMYTGLDAVGVDMQPKENYNEWRLIYFISFLLLVGFFVLNMFVGVVVENFHKCREDQEKEERERRQKKRSQKMEQKRKKLNRPAYWSNYSPCRLVIHQVVNSKYFDLAIAGVIGSNVITMAMEYYMMPPELEFALKIFNYFFTCVFIIEATMKIIALGFLRYIKDRWNQLDVLIVILSVVGIILEEMKTNVIPINPTIIRVMRVLRIARVLKLLKMAKGIRALLDTVIQALPQVGNLGLLFFLLFFIFAALGVELFGRLECSEEHPCEGLGSHAHFKDFGMAFLTLFRVATGDNWNGIMKDTLREDCDPSSDCLMNCCVNSVIAPVFFVIFVLMAQFVLVNVVVAVLMKHLEETYKYKEMDEELEEEYQRQLNKTVCPDVIELKLQESHRVMADDGAEAGDGENNDAEEGGEQKDDSKLSEKSADQKSVKIPTPVPGYIRRLRTPVSKQFSLPPSFTFCPPSNEQLSDHSVRSTLLVPIDIMVSSYNSNLDVSLNASGSSLEVPLTPSYYSDSSSYTETNIDNSSENVIPKIADELKKSAAPSQRQRRRLVRQKVVSESPPAVDKCILLNLYELSETKKKIGSVSQSHPTLLVQNKDGGGGHKGCEICRCKMSNISCRSAAKHNPLHRSQSSGAEKVKVRDKHMLAQRRGGRERRSRIYIRNVSDASNASSLTRDNSVSQSDKNVTLSLDNSGESAPLKSPCRNHPHTRDNTLDSGSFDWSADEAACDEEVRLITGTPPETEDEQVTPPWTREGTANNESSVCSTVVQSEATSANSDRINPPMNLVSTPTNNIHPCHSIPMCRSPLPPSHLSIEIPEHSSHLSSSSCLSSNSKKNSPDKLLLPNSSLTIPRSPKPPRLSPLFLSIPVVECPSSEDGIDQSSLSIPRVNTPVPSRSSDNSVSHNSISPSGADGHCDIRLEDSDQSKSVIKLSQGHLTLRRRLHSADSQDDN